MKILTLLLVVILNIAFSTNASSSNLNLTAYHVDDVAKENESLECVEIQLDQIDEQIAELQILESNQCRSTFENLYLCISQIQVSRDSAYVCDYLTPELPLTIQLDLEIVDEDSLSLFYNCNDEDSECDDKAVDWLIKVDQNPTDPVQNWKDLGSSN